MIAEGMDNLLKDWIQITSAVVAIAGGLIAAFIGISQFRASTKQREDELRWKKANLAKDLLNKMWDDQYCSDAILMLEWKQRKYHIQFADSQSEPNSIKVVVICDSDVLSALRDPGEYLDEKRRYIRDCFVCLFKTMEILQHYISIGLIDIEDFRYPFRYYLKALNKNNNRVIFFNFLEAYNFRNAIRFLSQIEQLKSLRQP